MEKNDTVDLLYEARHNKQILNDLLVEYTPFIKSCINKQIFDCQSVDDATTIAMLTFTRCVNTYDKNKGNFFIFAEKAIKRSLIDDYRLNSKHINTISFDEIIEDSKDSNFYEGQASVVHFEIVEQQRDLQSEITEFEIELNKNGLDFEKLIKISPKQKRSRNLCQQLANTILNDSDLKQNYIKTGRIPQNELAKKLNISNKTIEKYRKYLIVLLIILNGDYPLIRVFLPNITEGLWE
jgi:DNA-directed RNA polymerase specialized sigma subunit